jgi:hypothetical protein
MLDPFVIQYCIDSTLRKFESSPQIHNSKVSFEGFILGCLLLPSPLLLYPLLDEDANLAFGATISSSCWD